MTKTSLAFLLLLAASLAVGAQQSADPDNEEARLKRRIAWMGRNYTRMIQQNDTASIAGTLADDYLLADEEGRVFTKQQDLATYRDRASTLKIESVEYLDQNVRLIAADVAIDHSTIRFIGKRGTTPFDITERCTTVWAKRGDDWKIVADHFSFVKPTIKAPSK